MALSFVQKFTKFSPQRRLFALWIFLFAMANPLHAHEFWFTPIAPPTTPGDSVTLRLEVGEFFTGEAAGFSRVTTHTLRHHSAAGSENLRPSLQEHALEAEVALTLNVPGTHLFVYNSAPQQITLDASKFEAYLHDEGLDFVKVHRQQTGAASLPGRERFRRHIKTLVDAGAAPDIAQASDMTHATVTEQRLEIMPLVNPLKLAPGNTLPLQIIFDDRPLVGALVKAWHKHKGQLHTVRAKTTSTGLVEFNLPYAGEWMVSVVHMVAASAAESEANGVDWDSYWGNLSFTLVQRVGEFYTR